MAQPQTHDFAVAQGARWTETLLYRLEDRTTVVDLTGYTAELIIKDEPDGTTLATLSTANGRLTITGALGQIDIAVPTSVTSAWDWDKPAVYRLDLIDGVSERHAILEGAVSLKEF